MKGDRRVVKGTARGMSEGGTARKVNKISGWERKDGERGWIKAGRSGNGGQVGGCGEWVCRMTRVTTGRDLWVEGRRTWSGIRGGAKRYAVS